MFILCGLGVISISSGNGSVPDKHQAIKWTRAGLIFNAIRNIHKYNQDKNDIITLQGQLKVFTKKFFVIFFEREISYTYLPGSLSITLVLESWMLMIRCHLPHDIFASYTENLELSWCQLCCHWWHWRLSSTYGTASEEWWQITVSSVQMP